MVSVRKQSVYRGKTCRLLEFLVDLKACEAVGRIDPFEVDCHESIALDHDGNDGDLILVARCRIELAVDCVDKDLLDRKEREGVTRYTQDRACDVVLYELVVLALCERLLDKNAVCLERELVLRDDLTAHYLELDLEDGRIVSSDLESASEFEKIVKRACLCDNLEI